jgi:nitrogenase molybdenum-iron protein alpha/beta subunit
MHRATSAIVTDATVGIPLLRFITEDLEMITGVVCLRSCLPRARTILDAEVKSLGLDCRIIDQADVYQSRQAISEARPQIVFGSNIERHAVEAFDIPWVFRIVNPESRFRTIDREYFGYTGMLNLIEVIENDWLDRMRSRERRYQARW